MINFDQYCLILEYRARAVTKNSVQGKPRACMYICAYVGGTHYIMFIISADLNLARI